MEPKPGKSQTFYRWVDAKGRVHVVSSLDGVPPADRANAAVVVLNPEDSPTLPRMESVAGWRPDWVSFAVGFGVALLLAALFTKLPHGLRIVWRVALVVGVGVALTGLYLGMVRGSTVGKSAGAFASPSAFIEDAKGAVEQMNLRQRQQEEELRRLQTEH